MDVRDLDSPDLCILRTGVMMLEALCLLDRLYDNPCILYAEGKLWKALPTTDTALLHNGKCVTVYEATETPILLLSL